MKIHTIASYIPPMRKDNFLMMEKFDFSKSFIEDKLGIESVAVKEKDQETSDLCVLAFKNLCQKVKINPAEIDILILVTQNPDQKIPHTSAIIHSKLELSPHCICFDISQGCAGHIYGLVSIMSFMKSSNLKKGLLFTCDPYSKVIDQNDKNTSLLFGDAAAVTYLADDGQFEMVGWNFGILPHSQEHLKCSNADLLFMNGREIFNFALKEIPPAIEKLMATHNWNKEDIDQFIVHQGSKFIVDNLRKKLNVSDDKLKFKAKNYGNAVSSSIPLILEEELPYGNKFLLSGFGVGLSWGNLLLRRV